MLRVQLQGPLDVLVAQGQLPGRPGSLRTWSFHLHPPPPGGAARIPRGPERPYLPKVLVEGGTQHVQVRVPRILRQVCVEHPEALGELVEGSEAQDAARGEGRSWRGAHGRTSVAEQPRAASPPPAKHPAVGLQLSCSRKGLQGLAVELLVQQTSSLQG